MANFSNYLSNAMLNHVFKGITYTPPVTIYLALFTVAPTDAGGGEEVSGGGYVRKAVSWSDVIDGSVSNSNIISFLADGANYGTIVATGLMDAATDGNLLTWAPMTPATINDEDSLSFAISSITTTLD